ncbi:MAG TPA: glycosyltransferase family 1 protein [Candidatus Angelobacter sp.]|nr:glycosyltransferase family 1 protein [Candidatus Angelobacter sp.]
MTIAFDTWCLGSHARNHGVHVYASKLLQHFRELAPSFGLEIIPYVSAEVDNDANAFAPAPGFRPRQTGLLKHSRLWRFGGACTLASSQSPDLVFSPHCTSLYIGNRAPAVVTIHDVIPLLFPWKQRRISNTLRLCLWWCAKFSRAIITDSFCSRKDLVQAYGIPESKVSVVHLAHNSEYFNGSPPDLRLQTAVKQKLGIQRAYILHHGVIKPNKNLKRLIQAYGALLQRNRSLEIDLVLAGPLGWEYEEVLAAAKMSAGRVILTGALSDQELSVLLKGAWLAVFPSLYEGFCLPMIEAMACGAPTIAANSSCLPEISGGVLRYFNPESVEEMSACIEQAVENADLRTELAEEGRARASDFDWRRCAEETLAVLKGQISVGNAT